MLKMLITPGKSPASLSIGWGMCKVTSGVVWGPVSQSHVCELKNWRLRQPAKIRVA